jgi:hypothetical protein
VVIGALVGLTALSRTAVTGGGLLDRLRASRSTPTHAWRGAQNGLVVAQVAIALVKRLETRRLAPDIILNVNVPDVPIAAERIDGRVMPAGSCDFSVERTAITPSGRTATPAVLIARSSAIGLVATFSLMKRTAPSHRTNIAPLG